MNYLSESGVPRLRPGHSQPTRRTSVRKRPASRTPGKGAWVSLWTATLLWLFLALHATHVRAQEHAHEEEIVPSPRRSGQVLPPPEGMTFTTWLDRTALWVGDQFHYMITVDYSPNYEFVLDNLSRETINMDPLQVVEVSTQVTPLKDGTSRLFLDLTLVTYTTGRPGEQIPQLTLFYFLRDQHTGGAAEAAAESLTIPGPAVSLRSTLPPEPMDIRDSRRDPTAVTGWIQSRWVLPVFGWVSLAVLVAGAGWETAIFVRRRRTRKGPDRRKAMDAVRMRWASAVPSDFTDPDKVMAFYNQSYQDLKEYLSYYLEIPTLGLTAEELQSEMQRLGTQSDFQQKVTGVLGSLETTRYSLNGSHPNPEVMHWTAQQLREIFASGPVG
ncbi:MAG: hypothetical protein HY647_10490 [Acidobacteria bacterium]|nr:hypothetical protein [Acidobacteriota bacterium]